MANIEIHDKKFSKPICYYMNDGLKNSLDLKVIPDINKKDKDVVIVVDGAEGSGKSTLTFQLAKYVDPTFNLSRVVFNADDFKEAVFRAKKGQCIVYDEAFTGLSSRASLSGINRYLVSLMMQMRQKNLCVFVVLPTFFLLDKYVALFRTKALIHVYETGGRRGYFKVYSRKLKKFLFLQGRPTYSYLPKKIKVRKKGRFYGVFALGFEKEEEMYRKQKSEALEATEKNPMSGQQVKYMEQRNLLIYILRKTSQMTYKELHNLLDSYNFGMSAVQICDICGKFGDYKDENIQKEAEIEENLANSDVKVVLGEKVRHNRSKVLKIGIEKPLIEQKEEIIDKNEEEQIEIAKKVLINEEISRKDAENDEF
jgi:hypothetical protein